MSAPTKGSGTTWVGRSIRRLEDPALVAGQGNFTADLPAAHWVRFVRSPVASGRIERIGVPPNATVITAADVAAVKPIRPMLHKFNYVPVAQPILAAGVVRFVGEVVAAVVAPSKEEAEDIAEQVEIGIEPLTAVTDARRALAAGAPIVHPEAPGNVIVEGRIKTPDFDATRASAHALIKFEARSRRQNATPLEARAGHAAYDAATGRVTLTCTTQMPHLTRTAIADVLGMPESDLRVIAPDVGGGFGQKMSLAPEYVILVWLARRLRSSVAWTEDRRENLMAGFHSRDQVIALEGAFDKDARLTALSADIVANVGAYSCFPTTCGVEPLMAMAELPGPYQVQAYECVSRGVVTHTCPMAPYRGVSRPVITFALERLMDKAAARFGIDPIEIRRRNLIDRFPYKSVTGLTFDEASYRQTMEMAVEHIDLPAFRARQQQARDRRLLSRHRLLDLFRTHRLREPGVCGARHGDHAGLGKRRDHHGPIGLGGSAHRVVAARARVADDARPDHRGRDRSGAAADQGGARRHRPRALRLGYLREPVAGDCRRREPDRGAQAARASCSRSPATCSRLRPPISCSRAAWPRSAVPTARCRSRPWRARPITKPIASTVKSIPA